jgi:serine phosphatase RsbU (regulator of sigma subunit)/anti-sigma regulatory factor (Ser/Thr protein kinase)
VNTAPSRPTADGAQTAAQRLHHIQTLTDAALAHLSFDELLDQLLERIREVLQTDTAAILLLDEHSAELVATAAKGIEEEVIQGTRIPLGKGFAGRIAATTEPLIIEHVDHTNVLNPILYQKGIHSLLGAPLVSGGRVLGVVHVGTLRHRNFTRDEAGLLQLVADRAALAISAHLSARDRAAAGVLQRSLLPNRLPSFHGVEFAARYLPGAPGSLGGDWYDVLPLSRDRVGLAIGDVVGKGLPAAVVMGRMRSALRAYALDSDDPAEILDRLDRMVVRLESSEMATVLYAILERANGTVRFSSAGHLPPVLAAPDGRVEVVEARSDPPIGTGFHVRHNHSLRIPEGGTLLLYTDGVVERPGTSIDTGIALLCDAVEPGPAEPSCTRIVARLLGDEPPIDDFAVLAIFREPQDASRLDLVVPAVPDSLTIVRQEFRHWIATTDATPTDVGDLVVALGEACANAVEHAYGPGDADLTVTARVVGDATVEVVVSDEGRWRPPRGQHRGRGLLLMQELVDDVDIQHDENGTVVTLRRRIGGGRS